MRLLEQLAAASAGSAAMGAARGNALPAVALGTATTTRLAR
ncbi:hypothetical protein [Thermostaphylospora chromogena]|uniref:Uncharacterized protein n=1 Tax=Thermostaphylospora chromogena TaxID=35622 RepID=A0A1H1HB26_9ACTN|nr:hypothetical protein [Thermostaphylospora chromogena]SDR22569.1 hypothetical protein SAMN04489764_4230 [Thermostaphylospora chromogena]